MPQIQFNPLNYVVFEVVKVTFVENAVPAVGSVPGDKFILQTVSLHPLWVGPRSISYTDASRSAIHQTAKSVNVERGGRQLYRVQLSGTFGQAPKFVLPYFLNGIQRLKLFWDEVVRMPDLVGQKQVEDHKNKFFSPSILYPAYHQRFIEKNEVFGINFYDFSFGKSFSCNIDQFNLVHSWDQNNLPSYMMRLTETGPVLETPILGDLTIDDLLQADAFTDDLLNMIVSNSPQVIVDGLADLAVGITTTVNQIQSVVSSYVSPNTKYMQAAWTGVPIGFAALAANSVVTAPIIVPLTVFEKSAEATLEGLSDLALFRGKMNELITLQETAIAQLAPEAAKEFPKRLKTTEISVDYTFSEDDDVELQIYRIGNLLQNAEDMMNAHRLHQLSLEEHNLRLTSLATGGLPPQIPVTERHRVKEYETIFSIADQYGIDWETILDYNGVTTEDVTDGITLTIPILRELTPVPFPDIPVFDSHQGAKVLGIDFPNEMTDDGAGNFAALTYGETFIQGVNNIITMVKTGFFDDQAGLPRDLYKELLRKKLQGFLDQDKRIRGILKLDIKDITMGFKIETEIRSIGESDVDAALLGLT